MEVVPIFDEMTDKSSSGTMIYRSVATNIFFFLSIGFCGYFSTYETTGQVVIERQGLPSGNLLMTLGKLMIMMVLCIAYPINTVPMKSIVTQKLYSKRHQLNKRQ